MHAAKRRPRALILIALPAAVVLWSGWVGLGQKCGFGLVQPLPGITRWRLDTAITLPIGAEAYAVYALGTWLNPSNGITDRARSFARWSALGSLALGLLAQVAFHLLTAHHVIVAPAPVVVLVSSVPVVVVGCAAALTHLTHTAPTLDAVPGPQSAVPVPAAVPVPEAVPGTHPATVPASTAEAYPERPVPEPAAVPRTAPEPATSTRPRRTPATRTRRTPDDASDPLKVFANELDAGTVPSIRVIRVRLGCGQDKATTVQEQLRQALDDQPLAAGAQS
jgi:hypothetical protein